MLIEDLGYRAPHPAEEAEIRASYAGKTASADSLQSIGLIPAAVLHGEPLISYSGYRVETPLGLAGIIGDQLAHRRAWFLVSPTWTVEEEHAARELRALAVLHRARNPLHRLIFVCNSPKEAAGLQALGEAAFFYNKTANVPEWIFRPLAGVKVDFDAVYNAQLVPWKRHDLTLEIESCAFLFYRGLPVPDAADTEASIIARHRAACPGHVFINGFDQHNKPVRLSPSKVNRHLNRAHVGLCLSGKEGAMFASVEYLLSGLPVVSTPSIGGRDVYYDEEYCLVVPPDPGSVAEAVHALKARNIPRAHIRERTLRRIETDRARFLGLINAILEESGAERRLAMPWPFRKRVTMEWLQPAEAIHRAVNGTVDGFESEKRKKGLLGWRKWWPRLRSMAR